MSKQKCTLLSSFEIFFSKSCFFSFLWILLMYIYSFLCSMWLELLLCIFITLYGLAGLWTFYAHIPKINKTDEQLVPSNIRDYLFWLLTSIIFFLYAIFVISDWRICVFLIVELLLVVGIFVYMVYRKRKTFFTKLKKLVHHKKKYF